MTDLQHPLSPRLTTCTKGIGSLFGGSGSRELACEDCGACIKCVSAKFATGCPACNTPALRVAQMRKYGYA